MTPATTLPNYQNNDQYKHPEPKASLRVPKSLLIFDGQALDGGYEFSLEQNQVFSARTGFLLDEVFVKYIQTFQKEPKDLPDFQEIHILSFFESLRNPKISG